MWEKGWFSHPGPIFENINMIFPHFLSKIFCQILGKSVFAKQAEFVANVSVWHDSIFILSESGAAVGAFHILMTCAELKVGETPCDLLKSSSWLFI